MYGWLIGRLPRRWVDIFYVAWRAAALVLIALLWDLPFGDFTYLNL